MPSTINKKHSSLSAKFRSYFESAVRNRGAVYYFQGRVENFSGHDRTVNASVRGSRNYNVVLDYSESDYMLAGSCTCPFADGVKPCKHLWAVLLAADAKDKLSAAMNHYCNGFTMEGELTDEDGWDHHENEDDYDDDDVEDTARVLAVIPLSQPARARHTPQPPPAPSWKDRLEEIARAMQAEQVGDMGYSQRWPADRQVVYIIDIVESQRRGAFAVELAVRDVKTNGQWSKFKSQTIEKRSIGFLPDETDRAVIGAFAGTPDGQYGWGYSYGSDFDYGRVPTRTHLRDAQASLLMPLIATTDRCYARVTNGGGVELFHLKWEPEPWRLQVRIDEEPGQFVLTAAFVRGEERMLPGQAMFASKTGFLITRGALARVEANGSWEWLMAMGGEGRLTIPQSAAAALRERLWTMPRLAEMELPPALRVEQVDPPMQAVAQLGGPSRYSTGRIEAAIAFDYDGRLVRADAAAGVFDNERQRFIRRAMEKERQAAEQFKSLGFFLSGDRGQNEYPFTLPTKQLPAAVEALVAAGWRVEAQGKLYRTAGSVNVSVATGIDWFELHGSADFDGQSVALPELLRALKNDSATIVLADGSLGLLPKDWLRKYGTLAKLGEEKDDHLRFKPTQVMLLDALLAALPEANCDELFSKTRQKLRDFTGIAPLDPHEHFTGTLRPYQRDGLGWLRFLQDFRFGGCLADDMGLGKTIQVLALLDQRRAAVSVKPNGRKTKKKAAPASEPKASLAIVPRSLIFNWKQEAAKFAPKLRVLDHSGIERVGRGEDEPLNHLNEYDLILTTYGTLRRDITKLKDVVFDYVILDEAQAIKNANTASAKAVRLLRGDHRLVMTGTPVENRLSDLWSLFEFLNPGMLGSASVFKLMGNGASEEARGLLGKAIRPFILRRTKDQVATDLPAKVEQTVYCELEPAQRKMYNDLRDHYRATLMGKIARDGIKKSKIQVLEALLRLRQAALHPGLIDAEKKTAASAKLDALLPQLQEVIDGGHKALVFSQFTTMLDIVRRKLVEAGISFEYLDGQTRDRQACVERFQKSGDCKVFLISLKAGGVGLNLTSAEYVFLLDPWWNPAVESQAIDRAHRIGQSKQVFAYRLIAKDTVEEKVLELQKSKRELADAIISQDNSVLSAIGREELELLLS